MLETMYVRCTHCGYDNSPEYRFCGMCGASLAHPPVQTQAPEKKEVLTASNGGNGGNGTSENVHGPSFLGLAEDPKVEFHYLYEDEQPRSHVGLVVFLLLILGAAGYLGWQWQHHGFPFNQLGNSSAGQQSASPSEVAPAMSQNQETHIDKPMTGGSGGVLPTESDQKAPANPPAQANSGPKERDLPPAAGENANAANPGANPPSAPQDSKAADQKATPEQQKTEEAKATPPPPSVPEKPVAKAPTKTRTPKAAPAPSPTATPASPDSDLELSGERFLYGNGVPQNCARAESSLRAAATHGNTKAQTVLGTMYATGHCVGRDLPTAYRWFARALHQEPQNSRISADLQVLWRQMTPQEKQLATTSAQ
jgi:hypothetical protein